MCQNQKKRSFSSYLVSGTSCNNLLATGTPNGHTLCWDRHMPGYLLFGTECSKLIPKVLTCDVLNNKKKQG